MSSAVVSELWALSCCSQHLFSNESCFFAKIVLSCPPLPFVANMLVSEHVSPVKLVHPPGGLILIRNYLPVACAAHS